MDQPGDAERNTRRARARPAGTLVDLVRAVCALGLAAVALGSGGCIVSERPPPSRAYVVTVPPPAPLTDERAPSPTRSAVWVTGYWHWMGVRYAWIPGHWEEPPPGARWAAPRYSVREGAYTYEPGRWQPAAPILPPR